MVNIVVNKKLKLIIFAAIVILALVFVLILYANTTPNFDGDHKYAWGENIGWNNFQPTNGGVEVADDGLIGYLWAENFGWIKLDYDEVPGATNTSSTDWGVTNDGSGNLGGYGWGENIGWVNFNPTHSQVVIDSNSDFSGYAWAENAGWIKFDHTQTNYTPRTTWSSNSAPDAPSSLGPSNYIDTSWGNDNTPSLQFTQTDSDATDTVKFTIQISTSSDYSSQVVDYESGLMATGSTSFTVGQATSADSGTYTVGQEGQTLDDDSYYWRVMSTDNSDATSSWTVATDTVAFKIDTSTPTSVSVTSITETTAYQYVSGTDTVYYNTATDSDSFIINAAATDAESGVQKINFPALSNFAATNGGDDSSGPYSWTYNWTNSSDQNGSADITAYNNAGGTTTASFNVYLDTATPTSGSITYTDGYYAATSVSLTASDGTDSGSGVDTSTRIVQRKEATLSGGSCGGYGSWGNISPSGSYPNFTDVTVVTDKCYQYQYLVSDNVSNQATNTSSNTAKIDTSTPDILDVDAGPSSGDRISLTSDTWFVYSDTGSDDQISFSWTDPSSPSDDTFYYELNSDSGNTVTGDESTTSNAYLDDVSISEGTNYFHVRPRNGNNTWGTERTFTVKYDKTVPTSVSISSITADSASQLTIVATATDATSGLHPTPYWFNETSDNSGATDSIDWQASTTFVDTGLSVNTQYLYQVKAKDAAGNESAFSATSSKYTLANVPSNLSLAADSQTQITATWQANSNPAGTEYFCENITASTSSGWITDTSWQSTGLSAGTSYTFRVKARNGDSTDTNWTGSDSQTTQSVAEEEGGGGGGGGLPSVAYMPPTPPFSVSINDGRKNTNSRNVTLFLNGGPDAKRMAISNFFDFRDSGQEVYSKTKDWDLCKGKASCPEEEYIVYAKFYTQWGQSSPVVSDTIIYKKEKPIIEIPKIIKEIPEIVEEIIEGITEIFKPKPKEEEKPEEIPVEELVSEKAPPSMKGEWELLKPEPIEKFVLSPLPREIKALAEKFPQLGRTFERIGITKITDIEKLKTVKLTLPGLTERLGLPTVKVQPGKLALPQSIPVGQLSSEIKERIPAEIIFTKTGGEKIDFDISLTLTEEGKLQQRIATISGKPLNLVVKPDKPVKSVKGYIIFKSKTKKPETGLPLNSLLASLIFSNPVFAETHNPLEIEERLVLVEFEYTDPDGDGIYTADIQAPVVEGEYEIITVMDYEDPALGMKEIRLITVVDPEGYIYEEIKNQELRIAGAIVSLYWLNPETKQYQLWPAKEFQQENSQITDVTGKYSFLVPEGFYYLKVESPGYLIYQGKSFQVKEGAGIHTNIELKTKFWWLKILDWKTILLILVILLLLYNFYRDKIRERRLKKIKQNYAK